MAEGTERMQDQAHFEEEKVLQTKPVVGSRETCITAHVECVED